MDIKSTESRSLNMKRIRSKDTVPERAVRSLLHKLGYRFRLHQSTLPGRPDIVLRKLKVVIFVHGCFWHKHSDCKYAFIPKTNIGYWLPKLERNVKRDMDVQEQLRELGWKVIIVWECELKKPDILAIRLQDDLNYSQ